MLSRPRKLQPAGRLRPCASRPALVLAACSDSDGSYAGGTARWRLHARRDPASTRRLQHAAKVYGKIIPAFVSQWKEDHDDQNVIFQESYAGSTTQAANVIAGYEADVVALSLGPDVDQIVDAGLHPRLDRHHRQRHGLHLGRRLRRPARQPQATPSWDDLDGRPVSRS